MFSIFTINTFFKPCYPTVLSSLSPNLNGLTRKSFLTDLPVIGNQLVKLTWFLRMGSAPWASSKAHSWVRPFWDASWRGVKPHLSVANVQNKTKNILEHQIKRGLEYRSEFLGLPSVRFSNGVPLWTNWQPFCLKPLEIQTKWPLRFLMVWFRNS